MQAQHAITKLWKDIIHLQEDGFEKSDQEKEDEDASESRLSDEPPEKPDGVDRALPHRLGDASAKAGCCRNDPLLPGFLLLPAAEKVNRGENQELDRQTDKEELLVCGWLESEKAEPQIHLPDVIKNPSGCDVTDVHHHV